MSKYIPDDERDEIFKSLKQDRANQVCAECQSPHPQWASATLGIFICYQCSGLHRSFGVHLSFVRSLNMDSWTPKQIYIMQHAGNQRFLDYCAAHNIPRGSPSSAKYQQRAFEDYRRTLSQEADAALGRPSSSPAPRRQSPAPQRSPATRTQPDPVPKPQKDTNADKDKDKGKVKDKDPLEDWDGWGDTESSLAAIEKQQKQKQQIVRSTTPQGIPISKRSSQSFVSSSPSYGLSTSPSYASSPSYSASYAASSPSYSSSASSYSSSHPSGPRPPVSAYGGTYSSSSSSSAATSSSNGGGSGFSYQMGDMAQSVGSAVTSGWSKVAAFAKSVADSTSKAIQDSGFVDAVYSVINGPQTPQNKQQKEGLLASSSSAAPGGQPGTMSASTTTSSSSGAASYSYNGSAGGMVTPSAAAAEMKPAKNVDDDLDEILGKPIKSAKEGPTQRRKGATDAGNGASAADPDEWLDMALEQEAAKQKHAEPVASATSSDVTDDWDNW